MKMAAQATAQAEAEAATQGDEFAVEVNEARCTNGKIKATLPKKHGVGNGVDRTPIASATRVDAHEQTPKEDRAKFASFAGMEFDEEKNNARSHAEMFSATEIMQKQLLHHMQCLRVNMRQMLRIVTESNFLLKENDILEALNCDIDVLSPLQWGLLWFSAPSNLNRKFVNNEQR